MSSWRANSSGGPLRTPLSPRTCLPKAPWSWSIPSWPCRLSLTNPSLRTTGPAPLPWTDRRAAVATCCTATFLACMSSHSLSTGHQINLRCTEAAEVPLCKSEAPARFSAMHAGAMLSTRGGDDFIQTKICSELTCGQHLLLLSPVARACSLTTGSVLVES